PAQTPAIIRLSRERVSRGVVGWYAAVFAGATVAPQAGQNREDGSSCFPQAVQNMGDSGSFYFATLGIRA
ncbi:MAG TPA: hypothetical protein VK627_09205, partial [Edaphobacter sp.]|nr:hypothetical protein [Edaphobacter sp.]